MITQRLQLLNLIEGEARHDGVTSFAGLLQSGEPEGPVLSDGSAHRAAQLLAAERRFDDVGGFKQVGVGSGQQGGGVGVERVVAEKPERRSMKLVAPAPGDHRKQRPARAPVGGRESLGGQSEFLYAFHRIILERAADMVIFVVAAINRDVEIAPGRAAD